MNEMSASVRSIEWFFQIVSTYFGFREKPVFVRKFKTPFSPLLIDRSISAWSHSMRRRILYLSFLSSHPPRIDRFRARAEKLILEKFSQGLVQDFFGPNFASPISFKIGTVGFLDVLIPNPVSVWAYS